MCQPNWRSSCFPFKAVPFCLCAFVHVLPSSTLYMFEAGSSVAALTLRAPFKAPVSSLMNLESLQPETLFASSELCSHLFCGLIITPSKFCLFCLSGHVYLKHLKCLFFFPVAQCIWVWNKQSFLNGGTFILNLTLNRVKINTKMLGLQHFT